MSASGGMLPSEIFPDAVDRIVEPSGRCMSMDLCEGILLSEVVGVIVGGIFLWHQYQIYNRLWGCRKKIVGLQ